jgi:hypothetical protein
MTQGKLMVAGAESAPVIGRKRRESAFAPTLTVFQSSTLAKRAETFSDFERLISDLLLESSSIIRLSPTPGILRVDQPTVEVLQTRVPPFSNPALSSYVCYLILLTIEFTTIFPVKLGYTFTIRVPTENRIHHISSSRQPDRRLNIHQ